MFSGGIEVKHWLKWVKQGLILSIKIYVICKNTK